MRKILIFVLMTCCLIGCDDDNREGGPPTGMTDRIGTVRYAATDPCKEGAYSQYPDGVKSYEIECWDNGSRKKISRFFTENGKDIYKSSEALFRENRYYESVTRYSSNGDKSSETLYRADGTRRKFVSYGVNGSVDFVLYYDANVEFCPSDIKCVATDPD